LGAGDKFVHYVYIFGGKKLENAFFEEKMTKIAVYSEQIRTCIIRFVSFTASLLIQVPATQTDLNFNKCAESTFFFERNISDSCNLGGLSRLVTSPERVTSISLDHARFSSIIQRQKGSGYHESHH